MAAKSKKKIWIVFIPWILVIAVFIIGAIVNNCKSNAAADDACQAAAEYVASGDTLSAVDAYMTVLKEKRNGKKEAEAREFLCSYYDSMPIYYTDSTGDICTRTGYFDKLVSDFPATKFGFAMSSMVQGKVDAEYDRAVESGTLEEWILFKQKVPNFYWKDADEKIAGLVETTWDSESKAWDDASSLDAVELYDLYLAKYPDGKHASAAQECLDAILEIPVIPGLPEDVYFKRTEEKIGRTSVLRFSTWFVPTNSNLRIRLESPSYYRTLPANKDIEIPNGLYYITIWGDNTTMLQDTLLFHCGYYDLSVIQEQTF